MESSATKQQSIVEGTMASTQTSYFHTELELRRQRLLAATRAEAHDASLHQLLASVDDALSRLHAGTFGICESCHDSIEADRLLCNPLLRFCLDHLSQDEQRALERDLTLAAGFQRTLLPRADWCIDGWQARYHYQPANLVSGVRLRNLETGAVWEQEVDGFFVAIGHIPNTAVFRGQIDTDADGYILSKGGARTNIPGVFHAGDVQDRTYRQAITASGAGCMAAMEAERFLEAEGH
jgi:hypothetical protein